MKKKIEHSLPADKSSLLHDAFISSDIPYDIVLGMFNCDIIARRISMIFCFISYTNVFAWKNTEHLVMSDGEDDWKHSVFNSRVDCLIVKLASYSFSVNYNKLLTYRTQIEIVEIPLQIDTFCNRNQCHG